MNKPTTENTDDMEFYNMVQDLVDTINKENDEFRAAESFTDTVNTMQNWKAVIGTRTYSPTISPTLGGLPENFPHFGTNL